MPRKRLVLILVLVACLLLTSSGLAMSSSHYAIDWMVPLSGGGVRTSSTHYSAHLTVGQTALGATQSPGFQAGWGFWYGLRNWFSGVFLPLIRR